MPLPPPPAAPSAARQRSFIGTVLFSALTVGILVWAVRISGGTLPGLSGVAVEPSNASPLARFTTPMAGFAQSHGTIFAGLVFVLVAGLGFWETEVAQRGLRVGLYIVLAAVWAVLNAPVLARLYEIFRGSVPV